MIASHLTSTKRKRRKVAPRLDRLVLRTARREKLVDRPARAQVVGVCAAHAYEALGFSTVLSLVMFIEEQARQRGGAPARRVRVPRWKLPANVRSCVAVRCKGCGGVGCNTCGEGWWFRVVARTPRKAAA